MASYPTTLTPEARRAFASAGGIARTAGEGGAALAQAGVAGMTRRFMHEVELSHPGLADRDPARFAELVAAARSRHFSYLAQCKANKRAAARQAVNIHN